MWLLSRQFDARPPLRPVHVHLSTYGNALYRNVCAYQVYVIFENYLSPLYARHGRDGRDVLIIIIMNAGPPFSCSGAAAEDKTHTLVDTPPLGMDVLDFASRLRLQGPT